MSTIHPAKGQEPKRRRGHIRVAAIMEAGIELFVEKGYDATTMTEIAARSGTAIASLYRFFPTKDSLAEALLLQYAKHALDGLADLAMQARTMAPAGLAAAFVDYSLVLQSQRRLAIDLADVAGAREDKRAQFRKAMLDGVADILREAIPGLPAAKSRAMAAILLNVFKGVGAISQKRPAAQRVLLGETKEMLRLYLSSAAATFKS